MPRLIVLLLVALLALRGWGPELPLTLAHLAGSTTMLQADVAEADCPLHQHAEAQNAEQHDQTGHGPGCSSCDLCMPAALLAHRGAPGALPLRQPTPGSLTQVLASAELALSVKPPIS